MSSAIEITPVTAAGANLIRGYGNGGFRVASFPHTPGSVIVLAGQVISWQPPSLEKITKLDLSAIIENATGIDILVFGCGDIFTAPPKTLRSELREHGVALEWMDTGAACRTFNVLLSESREVAAALIAID